MFLKSVDLMDWNILDEGRPGPKFIENSIVTAIYCN
jgi:hypothetical protein